MLTADQLAEWLGCGVASLGELPKRLDHSVVRRVMNDAGWGYRRIAACIGVEKGGAGKTFLTINTAAALAMHGARVLLMDFDPQCCATNYMLPDEMETDGLSTFLNVVEGGSAAIVPSRFEGVDLVPARPELRRLERYADARTLPGMVESLVAVQTGYDVVLFDIPPFFGIMASSCYVICDLVVFPVTPDAWSIESISLTAKDVASACLESGRSCPVFAVLPNKVNPNRRSTGEVMARLREEYGDILLPFSVRESAGGLNAMNDGYNVFARQDAKILRAPLVALARYICPPVKVS